MNWDRRRFRQLVKEALTHLHDHVYLQLHPLSQTLLATARGERGGVTLHRLLLEALESLQPAPHLPATDRSWRPYQALYLRYVEGLGVDEVGDQIGLSPRQLRREYARGIEALADLLRPHFAADPALEATLPPKTPLVDREALASEVKRLGTATAAGRSTSLPATLDSVIATLADLEAWQRFRLSLDLPGDLPAVVVERVVLRQILLNLLTHFLVIGSRGTIEVSAAVNGNRLTLIVHYQGDLKQVPPPVEEDNRLAVAGRLARVQDGELIVHEDEATIWLRLPVEQLATVLVIDDNPDLIQLFRRYLNGSPFRAVGLTTSRQALPLAEKLIPQAIILDVMMPAQDGWELLQRLKNHPATRAIPIIICSVLKERDLALSLGAQAFLPKPVTRQMLLAALGPYRSDQPAAAHPDRLGDNASSRPPKNPLGV